MGNTLVEDDAHTLRRGDYLWNESAQRSFRIEDVASLSDDRICVVFEDRPSLVLWRDMPIVREAMS